ncbi:MAG: hypothetical protein M1817_005590 [Caeruleum heppii]|nr:MAG: hypothetical protein M1817_005590 [Caeruleum heppii]
MHPVFTSTDSVVMSSPVKISSPPQLLCPPSASPGNAIAPRKRRRRAPAGGAADDCFACRKRHVKCDRRRPYCTQCIDQGKDCSGYKTQLTWGVGVASRGKLRGLSLPIAQKAPTAPSVAVPRANRASCPSITQADAASKRFKTEAADDVRAVRAPVPTNNVMSYDFVNMDPTGSPTVPHLRSPSFTLSVPSATERQDLHRQSFDHGNNYPLLRQSLLRYDSHYDTPQVSPMTEDFGLSTSTSSTGCFSDLGDSDVPSPIEFPHTPEDYSFLTAPYSYYNTPPLPQAACMMPTSRVSFSRQAPTSYPDQLSSSASISSSLGSSQSAYEPVEEPAYAHDPCRVAGYEGSLYDSSSSHNGLGNSAEIDLGFGYRIVRQARFDSPPSPFLFDL